MLMVLNCSGDYITLQTFILYKMMRCGCDVTVETSKNRFTAAMVSNCGRTAIAAI